MQDGSEPPEGPLDYPHQRFQGPVFGEQLYLISSWISGLVILNADMYDLLIGLFRFITDALWATEKVNWIGTVWTID